MTIQQQRRALFAVVVIGFVVSLLFGKHRKSDAELERERILQSKLEEIRKSERLEQLESDARAGRAEIYKATKIPELQGKPSAAERAMNGE
jgi:formiminotetrahydrofolate cyclodeaminase